MVEEQAVITNWKGMCVHVGLGKPWQRCLCTLLTVGAASYALKMPRSKFDRQGRATPGFFLVPLTAAAAVYCLT